MKADIFRAERIVAGEYVYRNWQISRMENGLWNCGPKSEFFTDTHETLQECKAMIDRFTDQN